MPVKVKEIKMQKFSDLASIQDFLRAEKEKIAYQPIQEYLDDQGVFMADDSFGTESKQVVFNKVGFTDWCQLMKIPERFIERVEKKGLVADIFNDCLSKRETRDTLRGYQFVVDRSDDNTVLGIVSNKYQVYSNLDLLDDLNDNYANFYRDFEMSESYVENTNLYLRLLSNDIKSGIITGYDGDHEDSSRIGLQLSNSMVGKGSIKISYFIYRLVCSNGLVLETGRERSHIWHSGNKSTFMSRMDKRLPEVFRNMDHVRERIEKLSTIQFDEEKLVKLGGADEVYKIIPLRDYEKNIRRSLPKEQVFDFDVDMMKGPIRRNRYGISSRVFYTNYRQNQSMFDYVNLFTEYAHDPKHNLETRIDIETKTGHFVNWIYENML